MEREIHDIIGRIITWPANLEHIAKTGKINGSLWQSIEQAMKEYKKPKLNTPDFKPEVSKDLSGKDEEFSVDVFIIDENGLHGLAFYNFDTGKWSFHTDTVVDYNEPGHETKWWWYYPPIELEQLNKG